ncbi:uncharacterized protein LOC131676970 [Topomyia yanbarensis]|uniref:uncharacterized protein LOC131676970 n=1 Tax=Topomyia yanbarensis TaxID=2498891 RepID=UPI00273C57F2|nr:uncharacterized protein LOC131676970 [Topomyia yanbarensis]XP_058812409.1 uncharacterized protein LOC131676970 [Topomyia yanbarensis]XP_058812410.1 uncharacterized protein LOC131676970 [Topomyia yanbarensis]
MWLRVAVLVIAASLSDCYDTEEDLISVVINPRSVINYISQEFVGFSAQPKSVFEESVNPISETSFHMARNLGPMYVKVFGDADQLELNMAGSGEMGSDTDLIQLTPNGWKAFDEWAELAGVIPVFVLDYSGECWKPKTALKLLTVAHKLGIRDCLWQLGSGNITNAVKYVEDLRALQLIVKAFNFWGIVAADVNPTTAGVEQARYFNLNVDDIADAIAVSFEPSSDDLRLQEFVLQREAYIKGPARSHLPVWLDAKLPSSLGPNGTCEQTCLQEGLQYATLLGDAARNGFDAVFKSLTREEIQSYGLNYLIALLHRTTIGAKVFDVRQTPQEGTHIYAYCSRSGNGSITVMASNYLPNAIEFDVKLFVKDHSADVQQYVLTVVDGQVLINDQVYEFESSPEPLKKVQPLLKDFRLEMPAQSVGFWIIPNLSLRECYDDYQEMRYKYARSIDEVESTVDQLLQELIAERAKQDITQFSRRKRSITNDLQELLAGKLKNETHKKEIKATARQPRQTKTYRRKQQLVGKKEKRMEQRNLKRQKRPLRERGKRQLRKRTRRINRFLPMVAASKKTKRSFLAEDRQQTPVFGNSREEEANRSSFPQGDVHLVISKGTFDEDATIESIPTRARRPKKARNGKSSSMVRIPSEEELKFIVPELVPERRAEVPKWQPSLELNMAGSIKTNLYAPSEAPRGYSSRQNSNYGNAVEVQDIKVIEPSLGAVRRAMESTTNRQVTERAVEVTESYYQEPAEEILDSRKLGVISVVEPIQTSAERVEEQHVNQLSEPSELNLSLMPEGSEEVAHVQEFSDRRKRSVYSDEVDRIETFHQNNTKWQQRFAELFDMLLDSICDGEPGKHTVRAEREEVSEQQLQRSKRNALLHPQSWESIEKSNKLEQRQRASEEDSRENMVPVEPIDKARGNVRRNSEVHRGTTTTTTGKPAAADDVGRPGAMVLRTVTNLVKGFTTEFHRMFSSWFPPRTATE